MALENFRTLLKQHLRRAGYSHKDLAEELGWHPSLLSRKLYQCNYATLTYTEVKQIVNILTRWKALTSSQEAVALLREMGLDESQDEALKPSSWPPQLQEELAIPF